MDDASLIEEAAGNHVVGYARGRPSTGAGGVGKLPIIRRVLPSLIAPLLARGVDGLRASAASSRWYMSSRSPSTCAGVALAGTLCWIDGTNTKYRAAIRPESLY